MKLYYSPGACSLSPHIVIRELGLPVELEKTDLGAKKTAKGADFLTVNPKGQVPTLELDDGQVLTEGPAIVQYLADRKPVVPGDELRLHVTKDRSRGMIWKFNGVGLVGGQKVAEATFAAMIRDT